MAFMDVATTLIAPRRLGQLGVLLAGLLATSAALAVAGKEPRPAPPSEIVDSDSLLGSYLAAEVARASHDSEDAAMYYRRVLARDPGNADVLDDAFQLELASGNFETARRLAERLVKRQKDNAIAHIFLGLEAFKHRQFARADEHLKVADRASPGEPTLKLARAWLAVAEGHAAKAIAALEAPSKAPWATHFQIVQRGFIADLVRNKAAAEEAWKAVYDKKPGNARIAEAYARHLAAFGDAERAKAVIKEGGSADTPQGKRLLEELDAGKKPKLMVASAEEGMAEVFLGIGQVLAANNGYDAGQIYLRLALFLEPASDIARLELAQLYDGIARYDKAIEILDGIREGSPLWLNAQIRKALNWDADKKSEQAIAYLSTLVQKYPRDEELVQTLASLESSQKQYAAAIPYYDQAIELAGTPEKKDWTLFYARGIAYERTKQWPKAEKDLKKSIELDPDESAVLNYLGYSWIDQNMNIPQAFKMIEKAVKLKPNDGYIVDSLGWAYYVQKDYKQAVINQERAVELRPEDPTLNDHLGDIYWRLGRKLEAKYQWNQALTLNPEPEEAAKIKKKLESGLGDDTGPRAEVETHQETKPVAATGEPPAAVPAAAPAAAH